MRSPIGGCSISRSSWRARCSSAPPCSPPGGSPLRPRANRRTNGGVRNLGKAVVIWALVEAPALLGLVGYLVTRDFRALLATLAGLLLFGNYRPSRLLER